MYKSGKLHSGSRVAVIGGGPAGSFFAMYLARYSSERGMTLEVDIYEPKSFATSGPKGCNRCAGILSSSLVQNLKELGLEIPESVIRNKITTYSLHSPYGITRVENPNPQSPIYSVYRGGGPLRFPLGCEVSLDNFLLERARASGANLIAKSITEIHGPPRPAVVCEGKKISYDLVVLASGVNAPNIGMVGLDYIPPRVRRMAQDELFARQEDIIEAFGDCVRICLFPKSDLVFGSLTPKGNFINISLLGRRTTPPSIEDFLANEMVKQLLPFSYEHGCGCKPLIAVGAARNLAADGFVAIGDVSVTRLYKDGIGSALLTAREAARTVVYQGISLMDFQRNYLRFCQALERDNRWGKVLFQVHKQIKDSRTFFLAQSRLVTGEKIHLQRQPFTQIIWGLFTGSYSYGHILKLALSLRTLMTLSGAIFRELGRKRRSLMK